MANALKRSDLSRLSGACDFPFFLCCVAGSSFDSMLCFEVAKENGVDFLVPDFMGSACGPPKGFEGAAVGNATGSGLAPVRRYSALRE